MKKVLVSAYTFYNVGDDLFIQILCNRYKNVDFYIFAPKDYKIIFKNQKNLHIISSDCFIFKFMDKILKIINPKNSLFLQISRFMNAIIIIGGSLFIESSNWENRFELSNKDFFQKKDKFIVGVNFGPYKTEKFYNSFKVAFYNYKDICFRENKSYELFKDLPMARKANDIIFSISSKKLYVKENAITISVINLKSRELLSEFYNEYINKIKNTISYFINKEISVNLISFCEVEGDYESIMDICGLLSDKEKRKCNIINYKYNLSEVIETLQKSKLVIASRFHAMILGWKYKSVVVPLIYSDKMLNVIKESNFLGYYKKIENINEYDVQRVYDEYLKNNIFDITLMEKAAQDQFIELDKYLLLREDEIK